MSGDDTGEGVPAIVGLWAHDLRNPVATISANLSYLRATIDTGDAGTRDALVDVDAALSDLVRGLDQLAWISRWLAGQSAIESTPGDARASVLAAIGRVERPIPSELPDEPLRVRGGGDGLTRLIELLVRNSLAFAEASSIVVVAFADPPGAIIEVRDGGRALAQDLRARAFSLETQHELKERDDGRYSRVTGLFAARTLADALGAELTAGGTDGTAVFRVRIALA